ncbi:RidA family protein [Propionibacteriaceae bacterium Y1923]|uniref:RidA family protein n=1 Tax=Aestuariimicrobium sp. Y1814 TaxID=3418742 RepID=UPI003C1CF966
MSTPTQRLAELGLSLPPVATPVASYVPATRVGDQVWTSGQLPLVGGTPTVLGKAGAEVSAEQANEAARVAILNALAAAADVAGGLDSITRVLKVTAFVASAPGFTGQPVVANGASDLLGEVFGEAGAHVRSAVGVAELPLGVPVEIELVVQV